MSNFAKMPAFPQPAYFDPRRDQALASFHAGCDIGLNMQQHIWLSLYAAVLADPNITYEGAAQHADKSLPLALKRLEGLA